MKVSIALNDNLSVSWTHAAHTVTVRQTHKTTWEVVYLITTLSYMLAPPLRLLTLVRGRLLY